ncbi:MAG: O-antigen ligase family protein [bacterium]
MERGDTLRENILRLFAFFFGIGGGLLSFILYFFFSIFSTRDWHFKIDIIPTFLILTFFVSAIFSPFRGFSLRNFLVVLSLYITYLFLRRERFSQRTISTVMDYLILGGLLTAFGGFVGYLYNGNYANIPFVGKNGLGTLLATIIPISQIELIRKRELFYYLSFIILVSGLLLSMSEGAWIGLCVAECIFLFSGNKRIKHSVLAVILVVAVSLSIFSFHSILTQNSLLPFLSSRISLDSSSKIERIYIWEASWRIFKDHPIFGVGIGSFSLIYPRYRLPQAHELNIAFAHDLPLNLLVETGTLGFFAFFLFLFDIYKRGIALLKRAGNREIILAIIASFTAYMVHQLFDGTMWSLHIGIGFWFMGALILNLYEKI